MRRDPHVGDRIEANITGTATGNVAVGKGITQEQHVGSMNVEVTAAEREELRTDLERLRQTVAATAPPERRDEALGKLDELERSTLDEPRPVTMRYVLDWFGEHLPDIAGSVAGVLGGPVVGKIVHAAGDAIAAQYDALFGQR